MKKVLILVISSFLLVSCFKKEEAAPPAKQVKEVRHVKDFTHIEVRGSASVVLKNASKYQVVVEGVSTYVAKTDTINDAGTLKIYAHDPVTVTVSMPVLRSLAALGQKTVSAKNLKTSQLDLVVDGKGKVALNGRIGLRNVHLTGFVTVDVNGVSSRDMSVVMKDFPIVNMSGVANLKSMRVGGEGSFNFSQVNSPLLDIKVRDKAKIELAGKVRTMHLDVYDDADFDGESLMVQKAMVKTYDQSVARINVMRSQNTLANNGSSIYFYNEPRFMSNHMAENGAVLHLNKGMRPRHE